MSQMLVQPWWVWFASAVCALMYAAILRALWLARKKSIRALSLARDRYERVAEDFWWSHLRADEAELALVLRRRRLARLKAVDPETFAEIVRLGQTDEHGAELLIAEVTA